MRISSYDRIGDIQMVDDLPFHSIIRGGHPKRRDIVNQLEIQRHQAENRGDGPRWSVAPYISNGEDRETINKALALIANNIRNTARKMGLEVTCVRGQNPETQEWGVYFRIR